MGRSPILRSFVGGAITSMLTLLPAATSAQPAEPPPSAPPAEPPPSAPPTEPPSSAEPPPSAPRAGSGTDSPKRPLPDYDGRGPPETTAGDVALWIPRVLFFPLYVVSEHLVRRPLGWLIATAERNQWPSQIRDFFLFGPEKKAGVVPTAFLDFGLRASVGVYAFWDDLLAPGHHLRLHASTLGVDWLQGAIAAKLPLGDGATVDLRLEGAHRPDNVFHGLGPRSLQGRRARYGVDRIRARPVFEMAWWKSSRVTTEAGFNDVAFRDDACCDDPSLVTAIREGWQTAPPAFETGYTSVYQRGELTIDTRDPRPSSQSGLRLDVEVEHGSDVRRSSSNWIRYGGTAGGVVDVKNNRTVSLAVTTLFVDPLSRGAEIPFTEQVVLGGSGPMRGYLYGRLVDRSAAVATLKYKWPIWVFLDGSIQLATGNVFGPQLSDFHARLLRLSGAIGVESVGSPDHTFELLAGFGTETFERGAQVNSVRLLFGTNRGF
ncbi:MAG: BamA/TamA family outer membrane protein [Labilithrix sp.]|nr:BamA/TamA family outer membrane protein [Labilithrix sp.]